MDGAKGLIKALENWAKKVTSGYKDVDVRDMSSSFRDGLAFCAIIHHYRPDLIDFDSLSKENILENNSLAFSVAEKQLGVPALLDAEDMVKYSRPDRLSIITYLSQLRNCFENQNKVSSLKHGVKRVKAQLSGPPQKVPVTNPQLLPMKRHETCQVCKHRVFILERLIVDGKLYHTACFRCCKCNCLLNPGAYVESDTPGIYECSVCLPDENIDLTDVHVTEVTVEDIKDDKEVSSRIVLRQKSQNENHLLKQSPLSDSVTRARNNFLNHSLSVQSKSNGTSSDSDKFSSATDTSLTQEDIVISVKDKISAFEANQIPKSRASFKQMPLLSTSDRELSLNASFQSTVSHEPPSVCNTTDQNEIDNVKLGSLKPISNTGMKETENVIVAECTTNQSSLNMLENEITTEITSQTLINKASTSDMNISPDSKNLTSDKFRFIRQQSSINEYRSPIRKPRDIFQTNIQPLKLSIPSVNSTVKRESNSLPITPIVSPGSAKNFELPQIRSIYSVTLPRQNSFASIDSKKSLADISENRSESRRKSLESNDNRNIFSNETFSTVSLPTVSKNFSNVDSGKVNNISAGFSVGTSNLSKNLISRSEESNISHTSLKHTENEKQGEALLTSPSEKHIESRSHPDILETKYENLESFRGKLRSVNNLSVSSNFKNNNSLQASSSKISDMPCFSDAENSNILSKANESVKSESKAITQETPDYPDDLNPFGSDEEINVEEYPDDLNPFGDEDEVIAPIATPDNYDESKNPFALDDEVVESAVFPNNISAKSAISPVSSESFSLHQTDSCSTFSSPNGSLKGTVKKRQAPKPPKLNDIFQSDSLDSEIYFSIKMSPSTGKKSLQTPSPKVRKNKPAPLPPTARQTSDTDVAADSKYMKEVDNMKLKINTPSADEDESKKSIKQLKKKKRPAPPVPIPVRRDMKKIPLKEILREMKEIEEKQREYEKQGREIELLIRDRDKDEEPSVEEEEYIMQLFELVNQKNALFRRQAELMYIKRSQRLEEQQYEIEKKIRLLMAKPESEKTDEDVEKEQELTMELIDIVDQRNSIIDSIEMDRRRELEEDISVQEQIEIKNGDLPITAELKEKSSGKAKKSKNKKDKKKQNTNGESGKNTIKKKKWHLSKGT